MGRKGGEEWVEGEEGDGKGGWEIVEGEKVGRGSGDAQGTGEWGKQRRRGRG